MRKPIDSIAHLDVLNRGSRQHAFGLDALDWSRTVDRSKAWMPDRCSPMCFLPAYAELDEPQQRRLNQLSALRACEQFIWLERHVVIAPALAVLRQRGLPQALREALWHFVEEEDKHIAMFWRLLEKSEPRWYPPHQFRFFHVTPLEQFCMNRFANFSSLFLVWIWMAIFVEERTLFLSREYVKCARLRPGVVDAMHSEVHAYHMKDEARHHQLDEHLLTWLYDHQHEWKKRLCARMLFLIVRQYVFPKRMALHVLDVLGTEFSALRHTTIPKLRSQFPHVGRDAAFHVRMFGRSALPRTLSLLSHYREHDRIRRLLPGMRQETTGASIGNSNVSDR